MKTRRSERLVDMTNYLENRPYQLVPLTFFARRYQSAKSSISEDITIIKHVFLKQGIGLIETIPGAGGGVLFTPGINRQMAMEFLQELQQKLTDPQRILPGGYLYLSDVIGDPQILRQIGQLIATQYAKQPIDAIMTMATKGIPIAQSVAYYLNIPYVIVRRESKVTEGPTLSVNYDSGSISRVEKMELSKRSLPLHSRVIAIDDFMKGGGTVSGLRNLVHEFESELLGVTVLVESGKLVSAKKDQAVSLLQLDSLDVETKSLTMSTGSYLDQVDFTPFELNR